MADSTKSRGWGSLLSGAVAGLESRLDVILADDPNASAKLRTAEKEKKEREHKLKTDQDVSRTSSRNRGNDRLHARLAQAVGRSNDSSKAESGRSSEDVTVDRDDDAFVTDAVQKSIVSNQKPVSVQSTAEVVDGVSPKPTMQEPTPLPEATLDAPQANLKVSKDVTIADNPITSDEPDIIESRDYLEKIDALHAKVMFLSSQVYSNAVSASDSLSRGSPEQRLADQEAKIAQLVQEGEKLSHDQLKYSQVIKALRNKVLEQERLSAELRKKLEATEMQCKDLQEQLKSSQAAEKLTNEKVSRLGKVEKELNSTVVERDDALQRIKALMKDLQEADSRANNAIQNSQSKKASEQARLVVDLQDEISNTRIEKKLAEDRLRTELKDKTAAHESEMDKLKITELELRNEVQNLESKLEILRHVSEEATSSTTSDAQAKLLRQIEVLQSQYANANENWQSLESSLTSRVMTLEGERDELAKREADGRKKAREAVAKSRQLEEQLDAANDKSSQLESQMAAAQSTAAKLEAKLKSAKHDVQEGKTALERSQKEFESCLASQLEDERKKLQSELTSPVFPPDTPSEVPPTYLRNDSFPSITQRKASNTDLAQSRKSRMPSSDMSGLMPTKTPEGTPRLGSSRRFGSSRALHGSTGHSLSSKVGMPSPPLPMNGNILSPIGPAPEIPHITNHEEDDDDLPSRDSPQRTLAELVSVSTAGAGPSVQLVERMSATVRRLEMEKASSREAMTRLKGERDEAREEIVSMMREVDSLKSNHDKVHGLECQLQELQGKFDAVLEMLGEKTERCDDLENDVNLWKNLYHQHLDSATK